MGSKNRLAKYIVPIIQNEINQNKISDYIEPFVGGGNIIDKISCQNKYGSDNNEYLIALYNNLDKVATLPLFVTKEYYSEVRESYNKKDGKFENWIIGAVGFLASYNGRFFDGGYAGIIKSKTGVIRNYYDEAKRNLLEQIPNLNNIKWFFGDYEDLYADVSGCFIYCDPPYKSAKQYSTSKNFDHERFWNWARKMSQSNIVLVSESQAPSDWKCIWQLEVKRNIDYDKKIKATEKLFRLNKT